VEPNVGIFYWNQFADDGGLPPYFAEGKIWTPTSTGFVSLAGGLRLRPRTLGGDAVLDAPST
jgi:hypothetical protein